VCKGAGAVIRKGIHQKERKSRKNMGRSDSIDISMKRATEPQAETKASLIYNGMNLQRQVSGCHQAKNPYPIVTSSNCLQTDNAFLILFRCCAGKAADQRSSVSGSPHPAQLVQNSLATIRCNSDSYGRVPSSQKTRMMLQTVFISISGKFHFLLTMARLQHGIGIKRAQTAENDVPSL
jgi:hypothetical protein